jgi:hypothetical protein
MYVFPQPRHPDEGIFPAQHGVKWTLEQNMPASDYPQAELPLHLANMASHGRSGVCDPLQGQVPPDQTSQPEWDLRARGRQQIRLQRWNPQDAGANQAPNEFGGGDADNDGRSIHDNGPMQEGEEGPLYCLKYSLPTDQPFFLVVSLVDPHDVLAYPNTAFQNGYTPEWVAGDIGLPNHGRRSLDEAEGSAAASRPDKCRPGAAWTRNSNETTSTFTAI